MAFTNHGPRWYANPKQKPILKKKQHPNIEAIFEKTYKVKIKSRDTISIEEQRMFGVIGTGDKHIDKALANEMRYAYITINDMVEYFREGISFYLTAEEDSKTIFEAVTAHTSNWRAALKYAYNMGDSPVEDLILMEKFASGIYAHAKFEYEKRPSYNAASGTLAAFLYSASALPGVTYLNDVRQTSVTQHAEERNVKELKHEPDIDVFQKALIQNMGNFRQ